MTSKIRFLSDGLAAYIDDHSTPPDPVQRALIDETAALGGISIMQIGPNQGAVLEVLVRGLQPRLVVEIGTFTGYSSLAMARGLPPGGKLICLDQSDEWTALAERYWADAGVEDRIELHLGPAAETLAQLPTDQPIDLAFVDADKTGYVEYYEQLVPRLSERGIIAVDNTLWDGNVIDDDDQSADTVAIRAFNRHVADDPRTVCALTPIGDGLTLISRS